MANTPQPPSATGAHVPTVAVVLAAGAGRRFLGANHKLASSIAGRPLLEHAVDAARRAAIGPVVVVLGAHQSDLSLPADPAETPVEIIDNPNWADGQITSLRAGIAAAGRYGADAVVVGLGDQPFVTAEAWRAVAASDAPIAVATYDGERGHPVRLHRSVWPSLPESGDEGARSLIRLRPDLVEPVPCAGSPVDIDTLEDLQRWQKRSSTNSP